MHVPGREWRRRSTLSFSLFLPQSHSPACSQSAFGLLSLSKVQIVHLPIVSDSSFSPAQFSSSSKSSRHTASHPRVRSQQVLGIPARPLLPAFHAHALILVIVLNVLSLVSLAPLTLQCSNNLRHHAPPRRRLLRQAV